MTHTSGQILAQSVEAVASRKNEICEWMSSHEKHKELPLYSSVDIRDAGYKMCVVDTNLFPSGFNNLCEHGIDESVKVLRAAILERVQGCRNILVIAEEHTRNTWYLEHLRVLKQIIEGAGFHSIVATFLEAPPSACEQINHVELETATGGRIIIYSIQRVLKDIKAGGVFPCFIILNNDLSRGIPEILKGASAPIYPSIQAGWHSRLKSHHFAHTAELISEFARLIGLDPWFFSAEYDVLDKINIHSAPDRERIAEAADDLIRRIQAKYEEHGIKDRPFVFLKADRGTYGMGVMAFEEPRQVLEMNRKQRNKLYMGKGSQVISRYLLQEGVPTAHRVEGQVAEVCVYQIANQFVGGFYRTHREKGVRDNLNTRGMEFHRMCPYSHRYGVRANQPEKSVFDLYRILAQIAGIAAHREIQHLEMVGGI